MPVRKQRSKAELIRAITAKVRGAKPFIRDDFVKGLKYKTKPQLVRILRVVKVEDGGYGIRLY